MDDHATVKADWYRDPAGRHEYRYWDGAAWTDHVADAGVQSMDPPGGGADPKARLAAVRALEGNRGRQATDALVAALSDEDYEVRKAAVRALEDRQSPAAVEPLMHLLDSDNPNMRIYVLKTLIGMTAAEEPLVAALAQGDEVARDVRIASLVEAVHIGALKGIPRTGRIIRQALRHSWPSPSAMRFLGLLLDIQDPVAFELSQAINAGDQAAIVRIAARP